MFEWSDGRVCVHLLARSRVWLRSYAAGRGSKSLPPLDMLTETLSRRGAIYMSGASHSNQHICFLDSALTRFVGEIDEVLLNCQEFLGTMAKAASGRLQGARLLATFK